MTKENISLWWRIAERIRPRYLRWWCYLFRLIHPKYLFHEHEWAVTDSQGLNEECVKCGIEKIRADTWGERFNPYGGLFDSLTERTVGFLIYKFIVKADDMKWNRLDIL